MNPPRNQPQKTPEEWDQAEPDWDYGVHERDMDRAKNRVGVGGLPAGGKDDSSQSNTPDLNTKGFLAGNLIKKGSPVKQENLFDS